VRKALELQPTHLSLYALTVEEETRWRSPFSKASLPAVDDDLAAEYVEWVMDFWKHKSSGNTDIHWAKQEDDTTIAASIICCTGAILPILGSGQQLTVICMGGAGRILSHNRILACYFRS
jgi:coproporphyrinogen III oxidase-like Fe-S oxidoreductase